MPDPATPLSYVLWIRIETTLALNIGALGPCYLPAGTYSYTGSARRHPEARLLRHLGHRQRRRRWHIDYVLTQPDCTVVDVRLWHEPECRLNQRLPGAILIPGFGASDCRAGCGSHLRYLGPGLYPGDGD